MDRERIDASLRQPVENGHLPFVTAVAVDRDRLCYEGAFGQAAPGRAARPDSLVRVASMTKAITSLCVVQLVERGLLALDEPASGVLPALAEAVVLDGEGVRRPHRPITLRHLLTHTAGYAYPFTSPELAAHLARTGGAGQRIDTPLVADPGERWQYGVNTDWAGLMVEAASGNTLDEYMRRHVLQPLGMADTGFGVPDDRHSRLTSVQARLADGHWADRGVVPPPGGVLVAGKTHVSGGAGLVSTAEDYARFLRAMLRGGELDGQRVVGEAGFELLASDQVDGLVAGSWTSSSPATSNDVDFTNGSTSGHTLGFLVSRREGPTGAAAGTLSWAGIFNSYFWIDLQRGVAGATFSQFLPFADPGALRAHQAFQSAAYGGSADLR